MKIARFAPSTFCFVAILISTVACACVGNTNAESPAVTRTAEVSASESPAPEAFTGTGCVRTGCSAHICSEMGESVITTCQWRDEYTCYKTARCEKQAHGKCGWTPSAALESCIKASQAP